MKVYLDTCIISRFTDLKLAPAEARALRLLKENQEVDFVVSLKVKRELEETPNPVRNEMLQFLYLTYQEIPYRIGEVRGGWGSSMWGTRMWGSGSWVHPTLKGLRGIFEPDDAQHIFIAAGDGCDYFLTFDKETILSRVRANPHEIRSLCGKMRLVSPEEILALLENSRL